MAATQQSSKKKFVQRQFVVRLPQAISGPPGLYDRLLRFSLKRSREAGRRIAMTSVARDAIEDYLDRHGA